MLMRPHRLFVVVALASSVACTADAKAPAAAEAAVSAPVDAVVTDIDGKAFDLKSLRGKAVLVVNVASECGYTPQYAELQQLYTTYKDRGLVVVGFPSNDYGGQEPADGAVIKKFAADEYGVTFPLMAKVHTTGDQMAPLYKTLTTEKGPVKWNFTKFLLDPQGRIVAKFDSGVSPIAPQLTAAVEKALPKSG